MNDDRNSSRFLYFMKTFSEDYNPHVEKNLIRFWVCGVSLNIVAVLGILGNVISMIVLSRPQMKSSFNYLLMGFALCDTIFVISIMLYGGIPLIYPYTGHLFWYFNYVYPFSIIVILPIAMIAQTASIYVILMVTVERYVAVCHPLKAREFCTYRRAKISFIVCVCFAIVCGIPRFWEFHTVMSQLPNTTTVLHCARPTLLRVDPTYLKVYKHWYYLIVNYLIPFLTLAILNCLIYRRVRRANRVRKSMSGSETREMGLATILMCAVVVLLMFNALAVVLHICAAFRIVMNTKLIYVSNLLITINNSINFLIYISFGKKFREVFLLVFVKRRVCRVTDKHLAINIS
ncbi:FMRFamide receptor-like [Drosophila innubila]|uniref:FMRFamide receptor-like n=1 Tax=Drosophila innubila TaxID=198719 RepID=UPI00148C0675|nr:FMRFamide receptor-like [Drosophila innubila]